MLVVTAPALPVTSDGRQVLGTIGAAATVAQSLAIPVIEVRTRPPMSRRDTGLLIERDEGAALSWTADTVVTPAGWDGFFSTPLDSLLRSMGRDQLLMAGWWLETGVHSTMRSANDCGYECLLMTDLTVSASPLTERGAVSSVEMSGGIFGAVGLGAEAFPALNAAGAAQPLTEEYIA
jgi:nicotinamidase-related amidase